jgi:TonB-linked SusC/RagA family outer membrane protein
MGAHAQTGTVTGLVTDGGSGEPLSTAQVYISGLDVGTLTQANGRYLLPGVPQGSYTLTVQRIGYASASQQVVVVANETAVVDFTISQQALQLQEIVVTGLVDPVEGVRSPISVSSVNRETLGVPVRGAAVANLQGQIAGVHISRMGAAPGDEPSIMLRTPTSVTEELGGEPLIVVDGVILGTGVGTANLESADIESIEVIKGAAASSLYGSRAAAGVISIRTARGTQLAFGQTQFSARTELGFTSAVTGLDLPTHHAYLMDAGQTQYVDALGNPVDRDSRVTPIPYNAVMDNPYPDPLFNNLGNVYEPGSFQTQTYSFAKNDEGTNYQLTFNRYKEGGPVRNNDGYTRNSFRVNLDQRFLENFNLAISTYHSRDTRDNINFSFQNFVAAPPDTDLTAKDADGNYVRIPDPQQPFENPLWRQESREGDRKRARTMASANLRWEPLAWFSFMANASYDREDTKERTYLPKGTPLSVTQDVPSDGELEFLNLVSDTWNAEAQFSLRRDFNLLNVRTTVRGLIERQSNDENIAEASDFFVGGVPRLDAASNRLSSSLFEEIRSLGYLWDTAFDYAGKYIFTGLVRRDGSSLFGVDNRWHTYYRVAGAWRMAEEEWFNIPNVTEFKVTYARGTAGSRPLFDFQYETWQVSPTGVSKGVLGNRDLAPEHTTEQEVSVEAILFNRFGIDVVHAWHRTKDQLDFVRVPAFTGYSNQWQNGGVMVGSTTEVTFEAQIFQTPNFSWTSTLVGDYSRGKIESWPHCRTVSYRFYCAGIENYTQWAGLFLSDPTQLGGGDSSLWGYDGAHHGGRVVDAGLLDEFEVNDDGYLVWVGSGNHYWEGFDKGLWGTQMTLDGFTYDWGTPFQMMDANGNRQRSQIGKMPATTVGWINQFRIGQLRLHVQLHGAFGGTASNEAYRGLISSRRSPMMDQASKPDGLRKPLSYYQAVTPPGSAMVQDGSFVKLRTLSASYEFNQQQLNGVGLGGMGVSSLTIGLVGRDLFTISEYDWLDPEVGNLNTRLPSSGAGANTYPPTRGLTAEIAVTF